LNRSFIAAAALLAGFADAGALAQAAPSPTVQQQFDAATAALDARDWEEALRLYEALEARLSVPRSLAIVRTRKASALVELNRLDEAAESLRTALPLLPADDESLQPDRYIGLLTLGAIAERRFDYAEALRQYRLAVAVPVADLGKLSAYRGLVQAQLFDDPEGALRDAEAALAITARVAPEDRALEGSVQTLKGRALMNLGRFVEAREALELALRLLGNLTLRVDRADLLARSDLALAALLTGQAEAAKRYLAYTGAGRVERGHLRMNPNNWIPRCGGDLAPADVVVVQAAVAEDGSVTHASPVYASRRGPSARIFAQAVANWSFDRESVGTIPPLLRSVARLELRCSSMGAPGRYAEERDSVLARVAAADPAWDAALRRLSPDGLRGLRQELAALERRPEPEPGLFPALAALAMHQAVPPAEREAYLGRAIALAARADSPQLVATLALALGSVRREAIAGSRLSDPLDYDHLLALPEVRAAPRAAAEIRLAMARHEFWDDRGDRALEIAAGVRDMAGLAAGDPLRLQALEIGVAVAAARGDEAGARALFAAMGPAAERCGVTANRRRILARGADFPSDAWRWGFEGWAMSEMSVAPGGTVAEARTLVAYPAFVFGEAALRIVNRTRFDPILVGEGASCPADRQIVAFRLP
jgi:tetratricopeptide (TPR) repeat protein